MIGELLELPCVSVVAKFELQGSKAVVEREIEGGREVDRVEGWLRPRWEELTGVAGLGPDLPEHRPGCGGAGRQILPLRLCIGPIPTLAGCFVGLLLPGRVLVAVGGSPAHGT